MHPSIRILPQPRSIQCTSGTWHKRYASHYSDGIRLRIHSQAEEGLQAQANLLADYLIAENHFHAVHDPATEGDIHLRLSLPARPLPPAAAKAGFADETHRITITEERITIEAASAAGIARAVQSIRQMLSGQRAHLSLPCMVIEDAPALHWRGLHLDVSRHFRSGEDVKRFIDLAALHKFNLLHWHLTDDQGWRLPVEGYPRLTEIAAWRDGTLIGHDCHRATAPSDGIRHGGFYTPTEIREIVAHAAARGIHILPEIDVPGHVQALLTAYPEMGNTGRAPGVRQCWGISPHTLNLEPATFAFLERLLDTVVALFPFRYIHFGGDEAKTEEWAASPAIQRRKKELGIRDEKGVQAYFTEWLAKMSASRNRLMIGWDEIAEADELPADAAVMYWRDSDAADARPDLRALEAGAPLVLANWSQTYFDLYQCAGEGRDFEPLAICGHLPIEKVYAWQPLERYPEALRPLILGAQGQLWTEYIPTRRHLDFMAYPRACALAQVLWTGPAREDWEGFLIRLTPHLQRLDRLGVAYRPPREWLDSAMACGR